MGWVDYTIIGIILLSTLVGVVRGFLREVLSFVIWLVALLVAWTFHKEFAGTLGGWIAGASPAGTYRPTRALGHESPSPDHRRLPDPGPGGTDPGGDRRPPTFRAPEKEETYRHRSHPGRRVRCGPGGNPAMVAFVGSLTPLPEDDWWRQSPLIGHFRILAERILEHTPVQVTDWLKDL